MTNAYTITITIPDVFEGNFNQWQDCFFTLDAPTIGGRIDQVLSFCEGMGWDIEVKVRLENEHR